MSIEFAASYIQHTLGACQVKYFDIVYVRNEIESFTYAPKKQIAKKNNNNNMETSNEKCANTVID